MRARRLVPAVAGVGLLLLTGCSSTVTESSLDAAKVTGDAPTALAIELGTSTGAAFADMFVVNISWDTVAGLQGYELQTKSPMDDAWSTIKTDDDRLLFVLGETTATILGYDKTVLYRVRGVSKDSSSVTPWSEEQSFVTDPGNVLYEVEGTAKTARITMRTNTGTEQASVTLPLRSKTGITGLWLQAQEMTPYISAQATDDGSITCRITALGQVVSQNTSTGYGSIATCSPK